MTENDDTAEQYDAFSDGLAVLLEDRLKTWSDARRSQEQKMLECYQDVMRIARDDDTKGTGIAKARKSKGLFIGSTRNKVRSARAKIKDSLFGAGSMPFDTSPENEQLKEYADTLEDILTYQMEDMEYKGLLGAGIDTLATYGTGVTFGPFVRKKKIKESKVDTSQGFPQIIEQTFEYDCPYYELAPTLDVVPDPDAKNDQDGMGIFWKTTMSSAKVAEWKDDPEYKNIESALKGVGGDAGIDEGFDLAKKLRGNVNLWFPDKNGIRIARYFGLIPRKYLPEEEQEPDADELVPGEEVNEIEEEDDDADDVADLVEAVVIMAGGVVVKVSESPHRNRRPTQRAVYEEVTHEWDGVGVAENNMPHQKNVNAAFRLFTEGKAMALLGTKSVDRSKFLATEDFKKYPGKVYQFKPGLTPDEKKSAILEHIEPDITDGWLSMIEMSERFSDDDTSITKYTQGNDSRSLNQTASGISMIMNAASLPLKEVLQNIDEMWIENHIEGLIEWNLEFLDVEVVAKIHGQEKAEIWQAIKDFGKSSFLTWKATGASTFIAKEVLMQKLQGFLSLVSSNEAMSQFVDIRELLEQVWDAAQIGKESPIYDDKTLEEKAAQSKPENDPLMVAELEKKAADTEKTNAQTDEIVAKTQETNVNTQINTLRPNFG